MKTVFNMKNLMIMKNYNKYICAFVLLMGMSVSAWGTKTYTYDLKSAASSTLGCDVTYWYSESGCTTHCKTISSGSNKISTGSAATIYYKDASIAATAFTVCSAGDSKYVGFVSYSTYCYLFIGQNGAYITLPTYSGEKITNVTITRGQGGGASTTANIYSGTNAASTELTLASSESDYSFDISSTYQTSSLKFQVTSAANTSIYKIVITTEPSTFTVTYNDNGKDGGGAAPTDASSPYDPNSTVTVLGNVNSMTRTGYTFDGWNTKADGSGSDFTVGATFTITKDTTFYAKWSVNSHTLAVASVDNVVISATTPSVAEGSSTDRNYGTTVTLSHGDPDGGRQWGGWKVYKTSDANTTVSVDGNNQFTMPDYNVTVSANLYADFRFSCAELTLTKKLVTDGTPIFITSTAGKKVRSQDSILIVGNGLTANQELEFPNLPSQFEIKSRTGGTLAVGADGSINAVAYIFYTPDAGDADLLNKITGITVKVDGAKPIQKTLTHDVIGRRLPSQFVVAGKKNNKWYALPANMTSTTNPKPAEIAVDDINNPSVAYTADSTIYSLEGPTAANISGSKGQYIRFVMNPLWADDEDHEKGHAPLFGQSTGSNKIGKSGNSQATSDLNSGGWWWALTQTNTSITNPQDAKYRITNHNNNSSLSLRDNAGRPDWGLFASGVEELRLIPASDIVFTEAYFVEWSQHGGVIEVDAEGVDATSVVARLGEATSSAITLSQTLTSGKSRASKYNYTVNFGDGIDFAAAASNGAMLTLEWKNGATTKAVSNIVVPKIVASDITINKTNYPLKSDWNTEVHVLPGKTVTIDADYSPNPDVTIKELNIYPGATVVASTGTLIATNLVLRNGWSRAGTKKYDVARLHVTAPTATLKASNVYADWYIDYDQYYPVAVPWNATVANFSYRYSTVLPTVGPSANIRLKYYDGESRATNVQEGVGSGANWKTYGATGCTGVPTTLTPSTGYAMTAKRPTGKAFSIIRMPLTIPSADWISGGEKGEVGGTHKDQVSVTAWGTGSTPTYAQGWNLIANPYMSLHQGAITYTGSGTTVRYVNIPDVDFKEYDQFATATAMLKPASAFLIQAPETGTITFDTEKRVASAPSYRQDIQAEQIPTQEAYIVLASDEAEDMMGILVSEKYTSEYETNADLEKLLSDGTSLRTYMRYGDMNMAYVAINEMLAKEWIPVTVRIPESGEYTYSLHEVSKVSELEGVYLIDYQNGDKVTNLIEQSYTFSSTAGTINGRFSINAKTGERQTPTGIDAINAGGDINSDKPFKFIYHDKVYIWLNGVIYDTTGKRVK